MFEYYQVYSNDDPKLTLSYFTARSNLVPYAFVWEKGKTIFSETVVAYDLKLATDDRSDKKFLLISKLCPLGAVCSLPRGYIYVLNHEKNWKKIRLQRDFFETCNLQQMGKVIRPFCWHRNFVPWRLSTPAPGLYTCIKHEKNCLKSDFMNTCIKSWKKKMYKIKLQRNFFETCNKWPKWQDVPVDIRISSSRRCQPLPWDYIHV